MSLTPARTSCQTYASYKANSGCCVACIKCGEHFVDLRHGQEGEGPFLQAKGTDVDQRVEVVDFTQAMQFIEYGLEVAETVIQGFAFNAAIELYAPGFAVGVAGEGNGNRVA